MQADAPDVHDKFQQFRDKAGMLAHISQMQRFAELAGMTPEHVFQ